MWPSSTRAERGVFCDLTDDELAQTGGLFPGPMRVPEVAKLRSERAHFVGISLAVSLASDQGRLLRGMLLSVSWLRTLVPFS